jgi:hypothetical protein
MFCYIIFLNVFYQLALVTPGILPFNAQSLNIFLHNPNWRRYPLGFPVILQRLRKRTGEALRGKAASPA